MAVKNTNLGGTDWIVTDGLLFSDLNDTFDAAYDKSWEKPTFWVSSVWFTVYDAFTSEIAGAKWTTSGTAAWSDTSNAGGDAQGEAKITSDGNGTNTPAYIISNALPNNKFAYHFKGYIGLSGAGSQSNRTANVYFRERDGTNTIISSLSSAQPISGYVYFSIFVVRTAADTYDVYCGGKKIVTVSDADLEIGLYAVATGTLGNNLVVNVYMDDVRYIN